MSQRKIKKLKKLNLEIISEDNRVSSDEISIKEIVIKNWKFLAGLCVGIFLLYFNSLNGAFVSDDYATIPQNPLISSFSWALKGSVVSISNYFLFQIFGFDNPLPYHLFNLFIYLLVIVLAYLFVFVLTENKTVSQLSTILFSVLPMHVEAVSWVSGKPYVISSIAVLISLIILIKYLRSRNKKLIWPLIISIIVCFFTDKVRFFSFVLCGLAFVFTFKWKGKNKVNWIKVFSVGFVLLAVALFIIYPVAMDRINAVNSGTNASGSIFYGPFFQYPTSVAKYLQLMWFPADLTLYHTMFVFPNWLNWSIFLSYISILIYFFFKNKKYFFVLAFIFLAGFPSMAPIKVSWLVAERYLFLGSLGFAVFLSMILVDLSKHFKLIPAVIFISLMILSIVRVFTRNIDWQTNHNLWVNTCQVSPNSHNAWNNIGDDYDKLKDFANAIKGFTQSTIVKPNYADAYHNRANIFYKIGRLDLARESYQTAIKMNPGLFQTYLSLTQVDLMDKKLDMALVDAQTATQMAPGNPQSWYVLGIVQSQLGQVKEAKATMEKVLQISPGYKPAADALQQLRSST